MEQIADKIGGIIGIILGIALILFLIISLIIGLIGSLKTEQMRKELINKMNEHDKAVIMEYKNTFWSIKKHDSNNNTNGN